MRIRGPASNKPGLGSGEAARSLGIALWLLVAAGLPCSLPVSAGHVSAGLYDMVMIKDNHIAAAGGIPQAVAGAEVRSTAAAC